MLGIDPGTWKTGIAIVEFEKQKIKPLHYETLVLQKNKGTLAKIKQLNIAVFLSKSSRPITQVIRIVKAANRTETNLAANQPWPKI